MNKKMLEWIENILKREAIAGLYGTVTIQFQNGVVQLVKIEKSEKPPVDDGKNAR